MDIKTDVDVKILQRLYVDLKKYSQNVAKGMAMATRRDLVKAAENAIDFFYNDYDPKYYKRTNNLRENTIIPYYSNAHGNIFRGGVILSYENWNNHYIGPDEYVFNLTIGEGLHGIPWESSQGEEIPRTIPTPIDIIEDFRDDIVSNINDYKDKAMRFAKQQSYSVLKF